MEKSFSVGFTSMISDAFALIKMALTTGKGLAVVSICTFIYLLTSLIYKEFDLWVLIGASAALLAFLFLSWLIWFNPNHGMLDDEDY